MLTKYFRLPFASTGDKSPVPDTPVDSAVNYQEGYTPEYSLPRASDPLARDVERVKMNQIFNDITVALQYLQQHGSPEFIDTAGNGGTAYSYAQWDRVRWTDGKVYESQINSNTTDPSNTTNWKQIFAVPPLSSLAPIGANTVVANATNASAAPSAFSLSANSILARLSGNIVGATIGQLLDILSTTTGDVLYRTGVATWAGFPTSAAGRAISNANGTINTFLYFSAANTPSNAAITAQGRALIDDATAAGQRTTLGLGSSAVAPLIDDDSFATALPTNIPSAESVKAYVDANSGGFSEYVSPQQTITTAGTLTLAHGLGVVPKFVLAEIVCTTADAGYSVGDVVTMATGFSDAGQRVTSIRKNATNLLVRYSSAVSVFATGNNTSGAAVALTNGSWRFVVKAYE